MIDDSNERNPIEVLFEDYVAQRRLGKVLNLDEFVQEHRDYADDIQELFPILEMMEAAGEEYDPANTTPAIDNASHFEEQELGDYTLLGEIGRGGMGVVYEARHDTLGRRVALKVLPQTLRRGKYAERFLREARSAAKLHHSNIVPVFDFGQHNETYFYAMQFIDGVSLDHVLDSIIELRQLKPDENASGSPMGLVEWDSLSVDARSDSSTTSSAEHGIRGYYQRVAEIGRQVALALDYAHHNGILHRDIKPSNLLLDATGTVWVTDFGLAKSTEDHGLTETGDIVGTLRYLPPETLHGEVDSRSDLCSLGLTLYEMIALRPAYRELDRPGLLREIATESVVPLKKVVTDVPRDLSTIVEKLTQRNPRDRYSSAQELAEDLRRFLNDEPIRAQAVSAPMRLWRWCRRNKAWASLLSVVATLVLAIAVVSTAMFIQSQRNAIRLQQGEQERRETFSRSDFLSSQQLIDASDPSTAVAQLVRAVRTNPKNDAAIFKLIHTLTSTNFVLPLTPPLKHKAYVHQAKFSPNGDLAATVTEGGELLLWDTTSGSRLHCFGLEADAIDLAFSSDGEQVAVIDASGTLTVGNAETGAAIASADVGLTGSPTLLEWSPNDQQLLIASMSGSVRVVDATSLAVLETRQLSGAVTRGVYSSDSELVAVANGPLVQVLRAKDLSLVFQYQHEFSPAVNAIAFGPRGTVIASAAGTTVQMRLLADGQLPFPALQHPNNVREIAFSPDGTRIVTGTVRPDSSGRTWDVTTGLLISRPMRMEGDVRGIAPSLDGIRVCLGGDVATGRRGLGIFEIETGELLAAPVSLPLGARSIELSADGTTALTLSGRQDVQLWDVRPRATYPMESAIEVDPWLLRFAGGGQHLLTVGHDGETMEWDVPTGKAIGEAIPIDVPREKYEPRVFAVVHGVKFAMAMRSVAVSKTTHPGVVASLIPAHLRTELVTCFAGNDDGSKLLVGDREGRVVCWDTMLEPPDETDAAHGDPMHEWSFDAEVSSVVAKVGRAYAGTVSGALHELNLNDGTNREIADLGEPIVSLVIGENAIAVGSASGLAYTIENQSEEATALRVHEKAVTSLKFLDDGNLLLTTSADNTAAVWNCQNGQLMSHFKDHLNSTSKTGLQAVVTSNGTIVTGGSLDSTIRAWDPNTGKAVSQAMQSTRPSSLLVADPLRGYVVRSGKDAVSTSIWDPGTAQQLTKNLGNQSAVHGVRFSEDGRWLATASADRIMRIYDLPPTGRVPEWFLEFAEVFVGLQYQENGLPRVFDAAKLIQTKQEILRRNDNSPWTRLAQWLATEPDLKRSISPNSQRTVEEALEWLLRFETPGALERALLIAPNHPNAIGRLAHRVLSEETLQNDAWRKRADYLSAQALKMAPDDAQIVEHRALTHFYLNKRADAIRLLCDRGIHCEPHYWNWAALSELLTERWLGLVAVELLDYADELTLQAEDAWTNAVIKKVIDINRRRAEERILSDAERKPAFEEIQATLLAVKTGDAIDLAKELVKAHPKSTTAWQLLGLTLEIEAHHARCAEPVQHQRVAIFCYRRAGAVKGLVNYAGNSLAVLEQKSDPNDKVNERLISLGSDWHYYDRQEAPPEDWMQPTSSVLGWPTGPAELGYGNGDERTLLAFGIEAGSKPISTYYRRDFSYDAAELPQRLTAKIFFDDGMVMYLNGREASRMIMPEGKVGHTTPASGARGPEQDGVFFDIPIDPSLLKLGKNTIAVEVHQYTDSNVDLSFDMELVTGLRSVQDRIDAIDEDECLEFLNLDRELLPD